MTPPKDPISVRSGASQMKNAFLVAALIGLLGVTGWWIWDALSSLGGFNMPLTGWLALIFGVIVSLAVGIVLMSLVFYSHRRGFDRPPERHEKSKELHGR
jgi:cation transporter-like permease